jgi:hypothetical protein
MLDYTLQATAICDFSHTVGQRTALASRGVHRHAFGMFVITEADAAAIRATFNQEGELSAADAGGFQGSLTTRRRGHAPGASPDGCRCQPSRAR